jgi:hypothetical protein
MGSSSRRSLLRIDEWVSAFAQTRRALEDAESMKPESVVAMTGMTAVVMRLLGFTFRIICSLRAFANRLLGCLYG